MQLNVHWTLLELIAYRTLSKMTTLGLKLVKNVQLITKSYTSLKNAQNLTAYDKIILNIVSKT